MSLLKKIITAIRGGARETGEAIVDMNAIRILEQEIKDGEDALEKAKRDLTEVMAKEMQASRKVEEVSAEITKHEGFAAKALDKGDEALALEVAQKIAEMQGELDIQTQARDSFAEHTKRLKGMIKQSTKGLADMQRQLTMVKTTDSVHKATDAITQNYSNGSSSLLSAKESLDRIKKKQQDHEDRLKAGELLNDEFSEKGLEDKLKEAGIVEGEDKAQDILARIKAGRS